MSAVPSEFRPKSDFLAALIERGYVHLNLPARYDPKRHCVTVLGWEDWRKEEGELLWPAYKNEAEVAQQEKDMGGQGSAVVAQSSMTRRLEG